MSTMDNASAQLAIALQLHDLDELEASGTVDKLVIRIQRQQLEVDSGFDAVTFEASRRLALSMAKAVEDDSAVLARSARLPILDDATYDRLALLNRSTPTLSTSVEPAQQPRSNGQTFPPNAERQKRKRSPTPEELPLPVLALSQSTELRSLALDRIVHSHKKLKGEQLASGPNSRNQVERSGVSPSQDPQFSTQDVGSAQTMTTATPTTIIDTPSTTAACASCSDHIDIKELIKAACEHSYCKDCFSKFIEASLQTHDGFPPTCCKVPITFATVADNVSTDVFSRYSARQAEIKNATALYCGIQGCGLRIDDHRIDGVRATCGACWRDTCTICRGQFPRKVNGKNVGHVCKKDKAREEVLALAKREGWQTCFQCGNMVALNFGCHHMR